MTRTALDEMVETYNQLWLNAQPLNVVVISGRVEFYFREAGSCVDASELVKKVLGELMPEALQLGLQQAARTKKLAPTAESLFLFDKSKSQIKMGTSWGIGEIFNNMLLDKVVPRINELLAPYVREYEACRTLYTKD